MHTLAVAHRSRATQRTARRASPGRCLSTFVETQLRAAIAALQLPTAEIHTGVHEARKHLRRARAAVALAERSLGPASGAIDHRIGRVCRSLSRLRDAQALTEALTRLGEHTTGLPDEALDAARDHRDAVLQRQLRSDPALSRRCTQLQRLLDRIASLDWDLVGRGDIARAAARSERGVDAAFQHAKSHRSDDEAWHRLRRRLRRLRMQKLVIASFDPDLAAAIHARDDVARELGESQDDTLILAHCGPGSPFPRALRRRLARVATQRIVETRTRVCEHWDDGPGSVPRA